MSDIELDQLRDQTYAEILELFHGNKSAANHWICSRVRGLMNHYTATEFLADEAERLNGCFFEKGGLWCLKGRPFRHEPG